MKTMQKFVITGALAACAVFDLSAMPTKEETEKAAPIVQKLLASEQAALESGKKTRSEVAAAAMKLAGEADTEAAKLLLVKGAFVLYVRDGNLEQAVKTMNALEKAIADLPPQSVTNMVETALLGVSKKEDRARLYRLLDVAKENVVEAPPPPHDGKVVQQGHKNRSTVQSIIDGMIKVPGRDFWLSETELTQGQWEAVMGYNLSAHKGANLPVENVSRDDGDVFLEKLNQTKEVQASQFEFRLPALEEWKYAAWAGSAGHGSWIKPGVVGNVLDMAWVRENSSNQTHAVATKLPNAFGFYDMMGNVWEWLDGEVQLPEWKGRGALKGCHYNQVADKCTWNQNAYFPKSHRNGNCGVRLAAHLRSKVTSTNGLYCVIDISGGANAEHYPISYLDKVPDGGWSDEYKKTKIVFRRIEAGTWPMMGDRRVTFTRPFYIGIFELTQKQVKLISGMPDRKFVFEGDMRPADCLNWAEMRGTDEEFDYPKTKEVASDSIIGKLRAKTGLSRIDLQTSYQFGCAWNAGTDRTGRDARLTGRHYSNQRDGKGGYDSRHTVVGSYPPNEWGIYDLHGNVWEVCLDRLGLRSAETDPEGPDGGECRRNMLGGCWNSADGFIFAQDCVPGTKDSVNGSGKCGYRIVINAMPDVNTDSSPAARAAIESSVKGESILDRLRRKPNER